MKQVWADSVYLKLPKDQAFAFPGPLGGVSPYHAYFYRHYLAMTQTRPMRFLQRGLLALALLADGGGWRQVWAVEPSPFDVVITGGTVYDGTGRAGRAADVGIRGDRIAAVGSLGEAPAKVKIDAHGMAVAPGFINMISWSTISLIEDGRSQSEIREGVTTEIFGEGDSMGPLNDRMKERIIREQGDIKFEIKN